MLLMVSDKVFYGTLSRLEFTVAWRMSSLIYRTSIRSEAGHSSHLLGQAVSSF